MPVDPSDKNPAATARTISRARQQAQKQGSGSSRSSAATREARVPSGQFGGGRFTKGGAGSGGQPAPERGGPPDAHQQHVAHERAQLLGEARSDRAKASALIAKRNAMAKALASASGKVSKGQAGSKTASNATTSSNNAAPAQAAAQAAQQAKQQAQSSSSLQYQQGGGASLNNSASQGAMRKQIAALNVQIQGLLTAAAQAEAKAKALK